MYNLKSKTFGGLNYTDVIVPDGSLLHDELGLDNRQEIACCFEYGGRYWMKDGKYYTEFNESLNIAPEIEFTPEDHISGKNLLPLYGFGNLHEFTHLYQDRYETFRPRFSGLSFSVVEVPEAEALFDIAA